MACWSVLVSRLIPIYREYAGVLGQSSARSGSSPYTENLHTTLLANGAAYSGSSPYTGSLHFPTRGNTHEQPENIQFPVLR